VLCSEPLGYAQQIGRSMQTSHRIAVVFEQDAKGVAHVPHHVNGKCWAYRASMNVVAVEFYLSDVWE
jgi:hypothetical protein